MNDHIGVSRCVTFRLLDFAKMHNTTIHTSNHDIANKDLNQGMIIGI